STHEQRAGEPAVRRVGADLGERKRAEQRESKSHRDDVAGTYPVDEASCYRHDERRAEALRREEESRVERTLAAGRLIIQRQQQHAAEQCDTDQEDRDRSTGEQPVRIEAYIDHRLVTPANAVAGERPK